MYATSGCSRYLQRKVCMDMNHQPFDLASNMYEIINQSFIRVVRGSALCHGILVDRFTGSCFSCMEMVLM